MRLAWLCMAPLVVAIALTGCSAAHIGQEEGSGETCAKVIAHRGGGREVGAPDNSLAALEAATTDGLQFLEVDVRWSADGKPFLFHDRRLNGAPWEVPAHLVGRPLSSVVGADLEGVCASGRQHVCLLPLSKALDSIERGTSVLQVDLKGQASRNEIEQVVSAIQKRRLSERVVLFCDPLVECELVRDVTASIHIMARAHEASDLARLLNILSWAVQVDEKILSDRLLGKLRKQGVLVMVKTLDAAADTAEHWSRLEKSGVDLILTDYPRAARRQLCRQ